jgi:hypothetical protein
VKFLCKLFGHKWNEIEIRVEQWPVEEDMCDYKRHSIGFKAPHQREVWIDQYCLRCEAIESEED